MAVVQVDSWGGSSSCSGPGWLARKAVAAVVGCSAEIGRVWPDVADPGNRPRTPELGFDPLAAAAEEAAADAGGRSGAEVEGRTIQGCC